MPTPRCSVLVVLASLVIGAPAVAAAQGESTPRLGERVQVRIVEPNDAHIGLRCDGWVAAVARDTIVLGQPRSCPLGSYAAELRLSDGDHGSRLAHTGMGFVGGALAGGILARISVGDGCRIKGCDDGGFAVGVITLAGTAAGALVGALVGATLPAGPRWLTETTTRTLRVANLDLHPGLRVSFHDRSGR